MTDLVNDPNMILTVPNGDAKREKELSKADLRRVLGRPKPKRSLPEEPLK